LIVANARYLTSTSDLILCRLAAEDLANVDESLKSVLF